MPDDDFDEAAWRERIRAHREAKDRHFASAADSPIPGDEREEFDGLSYFPLDPDVRVVARVAFAAEPEPVALPATRGPAVEYERAATVGFRLGGDHHVLTAVRAAGQSDLLVPFTDATNGSETAAIGRYVSLDAADVADGDPVVLDFNLAYHPFSVYDGGYVAALPPEGNELSLPVRAGERL